MRNNKGFSLDELLVVVGIIAILVAISIPLLAKPLEASREAVDIHNMRSAYSLLCIGIADGSLEEDEVLLLPGCRRIII